MPFVFPQIFSSFPQNLITETQPQITVWPLLKRPKLQNLGIFGLLTALQPIQDYLLDVSRSDKSNATAPP
jgi:hypothetical protein